MAEGNQHLVPDPIGAAVKPTGSGRQSSVHSTEDQANDRGREISGNDRAGLLILKSDGYILLRDDLGLDQFPPTG